MFRVGAAYLVVAWLLVQVASVVEEPLALPDWFDTSIIVLLGIGFPVALIIAWAFELTPDGVRLAVDTAAGERSRGDAGSRLNHVIVGLLALAVVFLLVDRFFLGDETARAGDGDRGMALTGEPGLIENSIAMLPFKPLSDDEDPEFAQGVYVDLLYELERIGRLNVIARQTMARYADGTKSYRDIAAETRAQNILELLVRYADGRVRINATLVDGQTEETVWTDRFDEPYSSQSYFDISSRVARSIAEGVMGELSVDEQRRLTGVMTENTEALTAYLNTLKHTSTASADDAADCLEPASRAVALDPGFKEAWLGKAACHDIRAVNFAPVAAQERELSLEAIKEALAIDPEWADAYFQLAFALAYGHDWREANDAYARGRELGVPTAPNMALMRHTMGYLDETLPLYRDVFERSPDGPVSTNMLMLLYESRGDRESSDGLYRIGSGIIDNWGGGAHGRLVAMMGRIRQDQAAPDSLPTELLLPPGVAIRPALVNLFQAGPEEVRAELARQIEERRANSFAQLDLATFAAYLRAPDQAMEAIRIASSSFAINLAFVWTPLFSEVRQLEEFRDYMREIGMVDNWEAHGWPDLCRPTEGDDFRCD